MLHNNISNKKAPSMLFRVEDFLVKYKEITTIDKVLNKIMGKHKRAKLNSRVTGSIHALFRTTDFTVGLVCFEKEWTKYPKDLRDTIIFELPIEDIHLIGDYTEINSILDTGEYTYYVDDNIDNHSLVGHNRCATLNQINYLAKKGYKYE